MIKLATIGTSWITEAFLLGCELLKDKFELSAVYSRNYEKGLEFGEKFGCERVVCDLEKLASDPEIEAVSVCTPNHMHPVIAMDALRAGKNVLCEKPAARTYAEALEMQKVQHETGKVLNIGVVNRFNTAVNLIKQYIDSGKLGEVFHVYASFRSHRSIP
ncbi:MAG: Gfo/Idh/MocA family oxidoreductase, partial [Clostridia bacterium]|nr:Gfo/Idh/MocA family oxidoreductase [Clostridia bacterium]